MSASPQLKKRAAAWMLLAVFALPSAVQAAAIHTETFAGGAASWTKSGSWQLAATNQALRGMFAAQGVPFPETSAFVATNASSGGAFTGDYTAAGLQLIGFSFMAQDVLPSAALLRWSGPTSSFFRSFASYVVQTGVWYRLAFSLGSKDAGKWVGGTAEVFDAGLANVMSLEIQLTRAGMAAQRYWIDDVFIDGLPAGESISATNGAQVLWSSLRTNVAYAVQAAAQPSDPWEPAGSFVATNATQTWPDPTATNAPRRVYRLLFNESE